SLAIERYLSIPEYKILHRKLVKVAKQYPLPRYPRAWEIYIESRQPLPSHLTVPSQIETAFCELYHYLYLQFLSLPQCLPENIDRIEWYLKVYTTPRRTLIHPIGEMFDTWLDT